MGRKRILVADDDKECCALLTDYLTELGYEVVTVNDGASLYRRAPEIRPDLIISDLEMPGLSGGTAEMLLRNNELTRHIPIIFITGKSPERQARLVEFRDGKRILLKPLDLKEFAAAIEEELGSV